MKLCIGCGVCEYACNRDAIQIRWENGSYKAHFDNTKCINCGACERVCPFNKKNILNLDRSNMLGNVVGCYIGISKTYQTTSTSGGALTELCKYLLNNKIVDSILCVGPSTKKRYFQYQEVTTIDGLKKCARSAYYPVSIDSVKSIIEKANGKKYAVVGLPCLCTGLRKLRELQPKYKEFIKYILGIVCSYTPNAEMITHIAKNVGIAVSEIDHLRFRDKSVGDLYGLSICTSNGEIKKYLPNEWGLKDAFLSKNYILKACLACNNIYAIDADAVFMDAWQEGVSDTAGTSLAITRNKDVDLYVKNMEWTYNRADLSRAVQAQDYGHLIDFKIEGSKYRRSKFGYDCSYKGVPLKEKAESWRLLIANNVLKEHMEKNTTFEHFRRKLTIETIVFVLIRKICSLWSKVV